MHYIIILKTYVYLRENTESNTDQGWRVTSERFDARIVTQTSSSR